LTDDEIKQINKDNKADPVKPGDINPDLTGIGMSLK
jgi:hypothetical protein